MSNQFFISTINQKRINLLSSVNTNLSKCVGGTLAINNKIYLAPFLFGSTPEFVIIEIDENDDIRKIPFDLTQLSVINPTNLQIFQGVTSHPNGKIYFCPWNTRKIMVYDTLTDIVSYIGDITNASGSAYNNIILANDGHLYFLPFNKDTGNVMELNPYTNEISFFGSGLNAGKHLGGVYGSNGFIYLAPFAENRIAKIDIVNKTISYLPPTSGSNTGANWCNGSLGFDNKIYFPPVLKTTVLVKNEDDTFYEIPIQGRLSGAQWTSLQLAPNGNLYGFPFEGSRGLEVIPRLNIARTFGTFSSGTNSRNHGTVYRNGSIYSVYRTSNVIYKIQNIGNHNSIYSDIPNDISTISQSLYNKFQNKL